MSEQRWTEERGREVVRAWRKSGQSMSAFARKHGWNVQRMVYWRDRRWRIRSPGSKKLGTGKRNGTLWGYVGGGSALYLYCSTGHKTGQSKDDVGPEDSLKDRKGYTVADASNIFEATFNRADIIECACNMHARRYFIKALEGKGDRAALPIAGFKKLYDIEESIRGLDDEAKLKARQEESKPVYESLLRWCRVCAEEERPSSPLGKAAQYLVNDERFFADPRDHV